MIIQLAWFATKKSVKCILDCQVNV